MAEEQNLIWISAIDDGFNVVETQLIEISPDTFFQRLEEMAATLFTKKLERDIGCPKLFKLYKPARSRASLRPSDGKTHAPVLEEILDRLRSEGMIPGLVQRPFPMDSVSDWFESNAFHIQAVLRCPIPPAKPSDCESRSCSLLAIDANLHFLGQHVKKRRSLFLEREL